MMASVSLPVLLDTSVVSLIFRKEDKAQFYEEHIAGRRPVVSFQSLEELYIWPIRNNWGFRRRSELQHHLQLYETIWPDPELVRLSAELRNWREKMGRRLNTADAWIAATALLLGCPLASHDRDFDGIPGLEVISST